MIRKEPEALTETVEERIKGYLRAVLEGSTITAVANDPSRKTAKGRKRA